MTLDLPQDSDWTSLALYHLDSDIDLNSDSTVD